MSSKRLCNMYIHLTFDYRFRLVCDLNANLANANQIVFQLGRSNIDLTVALLFCFQTKFFYTKNIFINILKSNKMLTRLGHTL